MSENLLLLTSSAMQMVKKAEGFGHRERLSEKTPVKGEAIVRTTDIYETVERSRNDYAVIRKNEGNRLKAWWIHTDAPKGLQLMKRRAIEKSMEGDFETDSMRYKSTERYAFGYTNPRCLFGTPGL